MNLYIVESPLQLLCAYESISENNQPYTLLLRMTGRGNNDLHLINCAQSLDVNFQKIVVRTEKVKFDLLLNIFNILRLSAKKYETVYLGSYYSNFLKILKKLFKCNEIYYLDDGLATLRAQKEILKKQVPVNWYTFFELKGISDQKIIRHDFKNVKKKLTDKKSDGCYFIGQPYHLMNGYTKEDYLSAVKVAMEHSQTGKLKYIPHRVEDVSVIKDLNNLEIVELNIPVELYFISIDTIPESIYSCYSTALITLNSLLPNINIVSLHLEKIKSNSDEIPIVYEYFEKTYIKVIEF